MTDKHEQNRNVARVIGPALRDKYEPAARVWGVSLSAARKRASTSETIPLTVAQLIEAIKAGIIGVDTLQALLGPAGIAVADMRGSASVVDALASATDFASRTARAAADGVIDHTEQAAVKEAAFAGASAMVALAMACNQRRALAVFGWQSEA